MNDGNLYLGNAGFQCARCGVFKPNITFVSSGLTCCPWTQVCNECLKPEERPMSDGVRDAFKGMTMPLGESKQEIDLSQGTKLDDGKIRMDLLPSAPLKDIAEVLTFGAKKYAAHNWRKGINYSRVYGALQRHLSAWNEGEDTDPESGLNHLAHAGCCLLFLLEYTHSRKQFDDRYKKGDK